MISEVLAEIETAEEKAEQISLDSENKAKDIVISTQIEIERIKAETAEAVKAEIKAIMLEAEKEAERQLLIIAKDAQKEAENIIREAERNTVKAVELLAETITKTKAGV